MRPIDLLELGGARRTPLLLQAEASECGLACLAMIANFHGLKIDLATLRRQFSVSLKGATLKTLIHIAERIGFTSRPLRGELEALQHLNLPIILHWDLNHFVVLTKIVRRFSGRLYHIHDPAQGKRVLNGAEMSRHFTGVVLELMRSETFQPRSEKSNLRINQLWSRVSGLWPSLRNIFLLSIILQVVALAAPFYLQLAVDTVFPTSDTDLLRMLAVGFAGLAVVNLLASWLRSLMLVSLSNALSYQVIVNLFRHLLRLPLPWFEKRHVGDIISRFNSTQPIAQLLSQGLMAAIIDGMMAFITLGLMFVYSPVLAGIALLAWLLFAGLKFAFLEAVRIRNADLITTAARENSAFIESVRGISAIKAFGQEGNRQLAWQQLKADAVNAQMKLGRLTASFDAIGQFILAAERVVFVYIAISLAMSGGFTVGMIFAFQAYKQQFLDAATRLVEQAIQYRLLDVHLGRISDIALTPPEERATGSRGTAAFSGGIELRRVAFRYGLGEPEVLRGIDLTIKPGEMVVLVGPSGGGKTTLLKIMMGLFQPSYGQVIVDGSPLTNDLQAWRQNCGSVMQDDTLFAGTLAENIAFFDPEIDMVQVERAAKQAFIHDDIAAMPLKYDTLVGDMGSTLSGGQRQRVFLARALYCNPKILFVDEGTAHLDPRVEQSVAAVLAKLPITRVMIAHRPQALVGADRVIAVVKGQLQPVEPQIPGHIDGDLSPT
jgi:ATP-binding cassette, subfamily B, bacterial CvaB/MchF/RaxB